MLELEQVGVRNADFVCMCESAACCWTLAAGMASFLHLAETTTDQSRFGYSNIKLGCGVLMRFGAKRTTQRGEAVDCAGGYPIGPLHAIKSAHK